MSTISRALRDLGVVSRAAALVLLIVAVLGFLALYWLPARYPAPGDEQLRLAYLDADVDLFKPFALGVLRTTDWSSEHGIQHMTERPDAVLEVAHADFGRRGEHCRDKRWELSDCSRFAEEDELERQIDETINAILLADGDPAPRRSSPAGRRARASRE